MQWKEMEIDFKHEIEILSKLIYKSKNQHKSSLIYRKMTDIRRLIRKCCIPNLRDRDRNNILECAKNLYVYSSSELSMGFFIPLNLCILGVSARLFYLVSKIDTINPIDEIFQKSRNKNIN